MTGPLCSPSAPSALRTKAARSTGIRRQRSGRDAAADDGRILGDHSGDITK
jgi:hypothetical protein